MDATTATAQVNGFKPDYLPAEFYNSFLSTFAKERKPSPIRSLLPLEATPGLISLLAGKPNPIGFPFKSVTFTAKQPLKPQEDITINVDPDDLADGLQYGPTAGHPKLLSWIYGLQERMHHRTPDDAWTISVGSGSQDLVCKAIYALTNPGEPILIESPTYAGALPIFQSLNCELIGVETDAHGISTVSLESILTSWPTNKPKPKMLYTVPYGCNPTGMTHTLERRKEVLRLAKEHNFLILEDDPYFYIYYGEAERPPSYFSLESRDPQVGRVIRFDSFSKILSAGIRIGFASGPTPILRAIDLETSSANLQVASFTQVVTFSLLEVWGYTGFKTHVDDVAKFYKHKRDVFEAAFERHLTGLVDWVKPEAGMFFWFKILSSDGTEVDSQSVIKTKAFAKGVLALPGTEFLPSKGKTGYARASFSLASEEDVELAAKRLREAILEAREEAV